MAEYALGTVDLGTAVDLSGLKHGIDAAGEAAKSGFSRVGDIIGGALKTGVMAAGAGLVAVIGGIVKGVASNAEFERFETQFGVLLGNTEKAKQRLEELAQFGATTPFELPELVKADKVLTAFGLHSEETAARFGVSGEQILTTIGDVAAGTGVSFEELSVTFGKFASGATGEAIARFQELGIATREEMAGWGLEFSKSGELLTPAAEAFTILEAHVRDKFGGMMVAQSTTFEGMVSNLQDWIGQTLRLVSAPIFEVLKGKLGDLLAFLNDPATQAAIQGFADSLAVGVGQAMDFLTTTAIPALMSGWTSLVGFWSANVVPALGTLTAGIDTVRGSIGLFLETFAIAGEFTTNFPAQLGATIDLLTGMPGTFERIGAVIQPVIEGLQGFAASLLATFTDAATPIEGLLNVVSRISPTFDIIRTTIETSLPVIQQIITQVFGFVQTFIDQHGADVVATLTDAWSKIQVIIDTAAQLVSGIVLGVFLVIRDFLAAHGDEIQSILSTAWVIIKNVVLGALEIIQGLLSAALAIFKGDWQGAWESIQSMSVGVTQRIGEVIKAALDLIAGFFGTSLGEIAATWRHNFEMLPTIITGLRDRFLSAGRAIIDGVIAGVQAAAGALMSTLSNIAGDALQAAKDALGIQSPSTAFAEVGDQVIAGWLAGMETSFPGLLSSFAMMGEELVDLAKKIKDTIADTMADIFEGGADIIEQRIKNREFVADLGKDVAKAREKNTADIAKTEAALADAREKEAERQVKLQEQIADKQRALQKELALPVEKQDLERIAALQKDLADLEQDRAAPSERVTELESELALLQQQSAELAERERQMQSFRQRQAALLAQAEQAGAMLFKDDPARQADFFQMRSKQLQDIAKLEEEWFAARTQAERDQIEATIRDKQKQHELELAAFMQRAQQENATFGDLQKQYEDLIEKRADLTTQRTDKQTQLAKEKDAKRRAEIEREIADLDQQIAGTTTLIDEMQHILDPLAGIVTNPPVTAPGLLSGGAGPAYPALPGMQGMAAGQMAGAAGGASTAYTVVLRLEDERSSLFKDIIRATVKEEMTEAGWRGDTRKR